jgi:hypothetical protein
MVELRMALEAVRTRRGATQWETTADIRAWLDASAPPPPPLPAQEPPAAAAAAAAAAADADAAAAAASDEAGELAFASAFSWDAAKRGAEADEGQEGGGGAQGGRELRVMERVAGKLRAELEQALKWFPLVRAAPDAAAAACSQVTGGGTLTLALHGRWGAEGNWGGAWWWGGGTGGAGAVGGAFTAEPRGGGEPAQGARATRAAPRWNQRSVECPTSRPCPSVVRPRLCRRGG